MLKKYPALVAATVLCAILSACGSDSSPSASQPEQVPQSTGPRASSDAKGLINESGSNVQDRFAVPEGFNRVSSEQGSFAAYLQSLPLKPHGTKVLLYDGTMKRNTKAYTAVIDMDVGKKDLQQCADAVMRLRAEYLYEKEAYDEIRFHLTNGFLMDYGKWTEGYRVAVDGNDTEWVKKTEPANTYEAFRKYIEFVFIYAGSLSLSQEMDSVPVTDMKIGDVLIQGGTPGHAVIVVDMAAHPKTGKKIYMLAQSYMPAQDIQILANPNDPGLSPWYALDEGTEEIRTPEWTFTSNDLKRF